MLQEVILHIGCEKTGTNSLQSFLTENVEQLGRQGFHYPLGRFRSYFQNTGHFPVAAAHTTAPSEYLLPNKQWQLPLVKRDLRRDLGRLDGRAILSCEHFSSRLTSLSEVEALAETLHGYVARVVCYVREQASLLLAAYSTGVRTGRNAPLSLAEADPENPYFNHLKMLSQWERVFGSGAIIVVPYTRKSLCGGDVCADFCRHLGLDFDKMQKVDERYRSLDALQCEALRQLNLVLPDYAVSAKGWRRAQELRRAVIKVLRQGPALASILGPTEREVLQSTYRPINDALAARYLPSGLPDDWLGAHVATGDITAGEARDALADALWQTAASGGRAVQHEAAKARSNLGFG
jgi:hypothetical protein